MDEDGKKIVLFDTFIEYMKMYTRALCNKRDGVVTSLIRELIKDLPTSEVSEQEFTSYYNIKKSEVEG
jgi:hypothetical protein